MTNLDRSALVLNALSLLTVMLGFMSQEEEVFGLALAIGVVALFVSSIAIARRDREPLAAPVREPVVPVDELDPHTVLDLDARLDALERAQHDAVDAARWRALVESGQITAPASEAPTAAASGTGPAVRNGR